MIGNVNFTLQITEIRTIKSNLEQVPPFKNITIYFVYVGQTGPVTKIENIKTDATKILRPTHFSGLKDIKTDRFFVGLNL